ncbi:MAG: family 20 glycosylhydrolase [Clostridia bacterium]|nr:family 20 glycosylhydrolase [Clostridia bacterium]
MHTDRDVMFLPRPKSVRYGEGVFRCDESVPIAAEADGAQVLTAALLLREDVLRATGLTLPVVRTAADPCIRLRISAAMERDAEYRIDVSPGGALLCARDGAGLVRAAATLGQAFVCRGAVLPCLRIEDHSDFERRGYYLDCSRGRVPTAETLRRTADLLCRLKINEWQLYVEHTFLFPQLSEAWRADTPLTAEDILSLDRYCADRGIELVPSLSSFGHLYRMLATKTYADLCELPDAEKPRFAFPDMMIHHTVNPAHPDALPTILGLVDDYRALFTSKRFNVCCDETFDLGRGRSRESGTAPEKLYIDHVSALCRHLLDAGVTPQIWGDILLHQPETAGSLPRGTVILNWGYAPDVPDTQVAAIAAIGLPQVVCPGIQSWNHFLPHIPDAWANIRAMSRYGRRYGAIGMLNTDWGDFGHIADPLLSLPGIAFGAALSWNADEGEETDVLTAAARLFLGDRDGRAAEALRALSGNEIYGWWDAVCFIEASTPEARARHALTPERAALAAGAEEKLRQALDRLDAAAPALNETGRETVRVCHLAAEGVRLINRIGVCTAAGVPREARFALAAELEHWYRRYVLRWREVSREGQLRELTRVIEAWADWLRGRERTPAHSEL